MNVLSIWSDGTLAATPADIFSRIFFSLLTDFFFFSTAGTPNRIRREGGPRGSALHSQASSVTEVASDEIDIDLDEPQGFTS